MKWFWSPRRMMRTTRGAFSSAVKSFNDDHHGTVQIQEPNCLIFLPGPVQRIKTIPKQEGAIRNKYDFLLVLDLQYIFGRG